jgi:hypothetical protein
METRETDPELKQLMRVLAEDTGALVAFVCEACVDPVGKARTLALFVDGEFLENRAYDLAGTPCERVYQRGSTYHSQDVAEIYPEDTALGEWGVESYLGIAIADPGGRVLGHVGVMSNGPFEDPGRVETRVRSMAGELAGRML